MAIVVDAPRRVSSAVRSCVACEQSKPLEEFDTFRDGRGSIVHRRVCAACIAAVDSALERGLPVREIVETVRVSRAFIRARRVAMSASRAPLERPGDGVKTRTCAGCERELPLDHFAFGQTAGGRRRVCDQCLNVVDSMLRDGEALSVIAKRVHLSSRTITSRRHELGLPGRRVVMGPGARKRAVCMAAESDAPQIASQLGVPVLSVRRLLQQEGLLEVEHKYGPPDSAALRTAAALLDDGASYAETSRSTGIGIETLARHFPGKGVSAQDRAVWAGIRLSPKLNALHEEIMGAVPSGR